MRHIMKSKLLLWGSALLGSMRVALAYHPGTTTRPVAQTSGMPVTQIVLVGVLAVGLGYFFYWLFTTSR